MHVRATPKGVEVAIVSRNDETLDGLQTYLTAAGVGARCTRHLDRCTAVMPATVRAFVVFPDDFRWESVVAALAEISEKRPKALPVLITSHPRRFVELLDSEKILVVPRPVWGWTILEAIRTHLQDDEADR